MAKKFNIKKIVKTKANPNPYKNASVDELLKMDVYKLKTPTLKSVVTRMVKLANRRLKTLKKKAPSSNALSKHLKENNDIKLFDANIKGRNNIETLMKSVKGFLTSKTSTLEGFQEHRQDVINRIGEFKDEDEEKQFWRIYNDWVEKHPNLNSRFNDSFQLQSMLYNEFVVKGKTSRGAKSNITKAINMMMKETNISDELEDEFSRKGLAKRNDVFKFKSSF